ncbi:TasA family protein [Clostridium sp. D33t1_170424_F3]|uniref:TasA family protein n=1 Tax=Clostridium sp. D33t1_170424_F3 TaxID=2787099 RepID=UPI0018AA3D6C|nr:TasA family protein [Clostridium sp. D33t1_170424_F3]
MKTKKNRIVLSGISVLLVLSLLVGGTMAWFTDTEKVNANFSAGVLDIEVNPDEPAGASLEFENLRPLTVTQFDDELVQADLSNANQEGFDPVPVYFQPVEVSNKGTLPVYIQISAESIFGKDGFTCPKGGEKDIKLSEDKLTVNWDGKTRVACTNGLEDKLKIFVYAKDSSGKWVRQEGVNLNKASLETGEEAAFTPGKQQFLGANESVTYVIGGYLPEDAENEYQGKHFHGNVVVNAYQTDDGAGINPPDEPDTVRNTININFKEKEEIIDRDTYTFTANVTDSEYVLRPEDLADITPAGYKITGLEEIRTRAATGLQMVIPLENGKVVNDSYKTITAIVEKTEEATYTYTIQHMINNTETVLEETTGTAPAGELVYTTSNIEKDGKTYAPVQEAYTYMVSDAPEKNVFQAYYEEVKNPVDVSIKIEYRVKGEASAVKSHAYPATMEDGQTLTLSTATDEVKNNIPTSKNYVFDGEPQEQTVTYPGSFTGTTIANEPQATVVFYIKEDKAVEGVEVTVDRFIIKGTGTDIANPGPVIITQELADEVQAANGSKVFEPLNSSRITLPSLDGTGYAYIDLDKQKLVLIWENGAVKALSGIAVQASTASYTNISRMAAPVRSLMTASLNVMNTAKAAAVEEYYIYSQEDLAAIDSHLAADVYLLIDVPLTGNWVPPGWTTGTADKPFTGNFYGENNTISNLKVSGGSADAGAGLFAYNKGTIQDLNLTNVNVVAGAIVGSVAAQNAGTIRNCHVDGFVKASTHAATTLGDASFAGGITGANSGVVDRCSADVKVVGLSAVGGLVGYNTNGGSISECWTKGSVNEDYYGNPNVNMIQIGGLVGANTSGATINNCWSAPTKIVGYQNVGGFVGYNKATVKNSYVTDAAISYYTTPVHECVGSIYTPTSVVTNTYYVSEDPTYMAAKGTAIKDADLKAATALTGFDASVWAFPAGVYPVLKNNP